MRRLRLAEQLRACQLLAELLAAGFTLDQGLVYLSVAMPKAKTVWQSVQATMNAGEDFAKALKIAGFHQLISDQVALSAVHGQLADSLQHAGAYLQLQVQNRRRLRQLLVYPAILMGLLVGLQLVLWLGVLPALQLAPGQSWRWQIGIVAVLVIVGIGVVIAARWLPPLQRYRLSLYVPGLRQLVIGYYQYQFMIGASQFLAAGEELVAYCHQLAVMPEAVLRHVGQSVVEALDAGQSLNKALRQPLIYPPAAELFQLGQPASLVQAGVAMFSRSLFDQLSQRFERLLTLVQPVMFLLIGGQIVWVYMDILGPLYSSIGR
ncbi:type II secretion system F family protein [Lacticaseibacillus sp. GG6-2]